VPVRHQALRYGLSHLETDEFRPFHGPEMYDATNLRFFLPYVRTPVTSAPECQHSPLVRNPPGPTNESMNRCSPEFEPNFRNAEVSVNSIAR
jgi:hypothetical protein